MEDNFKDKQHFFFVVATSPYPRHRQDRRWQPRRQQEFSSTQPRRCSALRRSHGALQKKMNRGRRGSEFFFLWLNSHTCTCSVLMLLYRGISSRCSASALRSHRGKPRHQRKGPHRLAASAGRLRRKSCCSCSRRSRRASVRQLKSAIVRHLSLKTTVLNRKSFIKVGFLFFLFFFFYQDNPSGNSCLSL